MHLLKVWNELLDCRSVCAVSNAGITSDSLTLCILLSESVSLVCVLILHLTGSCNLKTLLSA